MFNIFFLVFFAVGVGLVLAVWVTRHSSPDKQSYLLPEEDAAKDPDEPALSLGDLKQLVDFYCQEKKLTLTDTIKENDKEIYWVAENKDPILFGTYVFGGIDTDEAKPLVPLTSVLEFKDFVKGAGGNKGFLMTTGYFSRDVHQPLEGVRVNLMNRKNVLGELAKRGHAPAPAKS